MSWTVANEPAVEEQVSHAAWLITEAIKAALPAERVRVAAIIGGYGRGEGGVERKEGRHYPHNNLDVLVVTSGRQRLDGRLEQTLRDAMQVVTEVCGIPVDLGCVTEHQLRKSRPRVMWYDVRFGHHVLCGDETFLLNLERFRADTIPVDDVVDLITNRGALAVIAKELVLSANPSTWAVKHALKITMKAIVGFGDALLWQRQLYDVSYREKASRMEQARDVDPAMRELYAEAVRFRFEPNYWLYEGRETRWILAAVEELEHAHQSFAAANLEQDIAWEEYPEALLILCLRERGIRAWVSHTRREVRNYWELGSAAKARSESWLERASLCRHRLAASLPHALYRGDSDDRIRFIRSWAEECDSNFPAELGSQLGLQEAA
jgi:hypothetical protein